MGTVVLDESEWEWIPLYEDEQKTLVWKEEPPQWNDPFQFPSLMDAVQSPPPAAAVSYRIHEDYPSSSPSPPTLVTKKRKKKKKMFVRI